MTFDHASHLARRPAEDGYIEIFQSLSVNERRVPTHRLDRSYTSTWRYSQMGVVLLRGGDGFSTTIPWSSITSFDVRDNSLAVEQRLVDWLRECDHSWLSHPSIGSYCEYCRLDMDDLATVENPKTTIAPALVSCSTLLDAQARQNDAVDPQQPQQETIHSDQGDSEVVVFQVNSNIQCGCQSPSEAMALQHSGPCMFRPDTWGHDSLGGSGLGF